MITESIAEHKTAETDNFLYAEVVQHTLFCKKKIEVVYGREPTLEVLSLNQHGRKVYRILLPGGAPHEKVSNIDAGQKN